MMIINTGQRTDIPGFYSTWFLNRLKAGHVLVRNPFNHTQVTRYRLDPEVVDVICFCTKNPAPMIPHVEELSDYRQLWHVTITPYGRDVEPGVPAVREVVRSFRTLSRMLGPSHVVWRYDPILLWGRYSLSFHIRAFSYLAEALEGYTHNCILSFVDLYGKTIHKFPDLCRVNHENQLYLVEKMAEIAGKHSMKLISCLENPAFASLGVDTTGCLTKEKVEEVLGCHLVIPSYENLHARKGCDCLLGHDIGAYNTCAHFCRYCYANESRESVLEHMKRHDPQSPLITGWLKKEDEIREARQESWLDRQQSLF